MASTVLGDIDFNSSTWKDIFAGEFTDRLGLLYKRSNGIGS